MRTDKNRVSRYWEFRMDENDDGTKKNSLSEDLVNFMNQSVKTGSWKINRETGKIDVNGSVDANLNRYDIDEIKENKIQFGRVSGEFLWNSFQDIEDLSMMPREIGHNFSLSSCYLKSCKNFPDEVGRDIDLSFLSELGSLEGLPEKVNGDLSLQYSKVKSLKGSPKKVKGSYSVHRSEIIDLEGAPEEVGKNFKAGDNKSLISLKGFPEVVNGWADISNCPNLKKLDHIKNSGGGIWMDGCSLTSLRGLPEDFSRVSFPFSLQNNMIICLDGIPSEYLEREVGNGLEYMVSGINLLGNPIDQSVLYEGLGKRIETGDWKESWQLSYSSDPGAFYSAWETMDNVDQDYVLDQLGVNRSEFIKVSKVRSRFI
jgi:hypothetical protein